VLVLREHPARGGPDVDEAQLADELPDDYVCRVCRVKADVGWDRVVQRRLRRFPVLAADTVVCVDEKILGKPADPADAARMLRLLSGREHRVPHRGRAQVRGAHRDRLEREPGAFCELAKPELEAYIESGEPTDKAGASRRRGFPAAVQLIRMSSVTRRMS